MSLKTPAVYTHGEAVAKPVDMEKETQNYATLSR